MNLSRLLAIPVLLCCVAPTQAAERAPQRPNIVLMYTDDQRYDALSIAGHPFLQTPNLDRLAREGAYCRNAFVSISLCGPSRASILTGQYAHTHGVIRNNGTDLRADAVTYPKLLQKAGYQTAYVGKWHQALHDEPRPGFDYWVSYRGQGLYYKSRINENGKRSQPEGYIDDIMTDYAIRWIREGRDPSKPFALTLGFKSVHGPFTPPERTKDLYADVELTRPATYNVDLSNRPAFIRKWIENEIGKHMLFEYDVFIRNYNRCIRGTDDNVGRVIAALRETGLLDNTLVVFTSDNGYYQSEHGGLFDKRSAYEESIRVPMLIRWPARIRPGTQLEPMVLNIDLAPTFLDAAGVPIPASMHGRSMLPLFDGRQEGWRKSFFYEYFREKNYPNTPTIQAVRTERYKYITYLNPEDRPELFDLQKDPHETRNLHDDPAVAGVLADLRGELNRLRKETGAPSVEELRAEKIDIPVN